MLYNFKFSCEIYNKLKEQKGSKEKTPIYNSCYHQTLITRKLSSPRKHDNLSHHHNFILQINFLEIFTEILKICHKVCLV